MQTQLLKSTENLSKPLKYLNVLSMLYITILYVSTLLVHKIITIFGVPISTSTLIFPLTYFLGDAIAEVYGYKISRRIIWVSLGCLFIFDFLPAILIHLPSPDYWHEQRAYNQVVGPMPRIFIGDFLSMNISAFVNIYLLTKWKLLIKGKYFWLRSIASTAIGEAVFTGMVFTIVFAGTIPFSEWSKAMVFSYIFKIVFGIVAIYPIVLLTNKIKVAEGIDVYDYNTNFNPFRLDI